MTGVGAVSAWGWGSDALWDGLLSGHTGVREAERFDTRGQRSHLAGEVPAAPAEMASAFPGWRHYSRADRFAVAAAVEACRQAGLEAPDAAAEPLGSEIGVFFGGSTAGMAEGEEYFHRLTSGAQGPARLRLLASQQLNGPSDAVARLLGVTGPVRAFSSACAAGALAIGVALDSLRCGEVEAAIAGGADSLCRLTYSGFNALRAVDARPCRPFRQDRGGLNLGEGAGVLFLEPRSRARRRGVRVLAELMGSGASCDAHHMTAPHPRGDGAAQAMAKALRDAGVGADAIDFINAHGTGTPHNDASEWRAIEQVFGTRAPRIAVTSTKASVGHLLGSSGALEAIATIQCLVAGQVHSTPGDGEIDDSFDVDLVRGGPRRLAGPAAGGAGSPHRAISTSFGFGGANAALVFAAPRGAAVPRRPTS
ncbi:MAG: beta-ketoacyl-[acyl-carrier-protein] synthase family protein [bacterium]|nr:beta-ketoacyl-[acyl-carrier-protein] synthase family protein [bacterium]